MIHAAKEANCGKGSGDALVFFDYLSICQRPRTNEEDLEFAKALESLPFIYLYADATVQPTPRTMHCSWAPIRSRETG